MKFIEIIVSAVFATSLMTAFSYIMSGVFRRLYKEPVLLEMLMTAFRMELTESQKKAAAWGIHYLIGLLFTSIYYMPAIMEKNWYYIDYISGVVFGGIAGTVGIVWWKIMFMLSGNAPLIEPPGYYLQLFFAHLVFGLSIVWMHLLFRAFGWGI